MLVETNYDKERLIGFGFLVLLLLIAGTSASIVGYRIKSIEWSTRSGLTQAYNSLVANPKDPVILKPPPHPVTGYKEQFVLTYELNQFVRGFGLFKALKELPPENIAKVDSVLKEFKNTDASAILNDVKREMVSDPLKAEQLARGYSKSEARKVERELYKFGLATELISSSK